MYCRFAKTKSVKHGKEKTADNMGFCKMRVEENLRKF